MGNTIVADKPPIASPYDQWKVYRATTKTGSYNVISTQAIADLTYYDQDGTSTHWYKISYYDESEAAESGLSDPIMGQSTIYTTVAKVLSLLQMDGGTDTTSPSTQEIIEVINRKEDEIDNATGHSWRTRYSGTNSGLDTTPQYEYYDVSAHYEYQTGSPIYLKHRHVKTLDADEGDALEFWNGAEWEDWLDTRTEGRNNDYWLEYNMGMVYLRGYWYIRKPQGLRIKYRYGESFLNRDIEDIATKMVCMDLLTGMDPRAMIVQEGGVMTHDARVSRWRKSVDEKLNRYKEWQVPTHNV